MAGRVVSGLVGEATADTPVTVADIATHDASGMVRAFDLPNDWGDVAAGDGLLAWADALPEGDARPASVRLHPRS